jgi:hypothetical protein
MSTLFKVAMFALLLSAAPSLAQARGGAGFGHGPRSFAVPELDGDAAGTAGALLVGVALLLSSRRRDAA